MTREEAKELMPIMQAFADGKTIQIKKEGDWLDVGENTEVYFSESPSDYRIKPEPKYRPFKSQEECWNEMLKHQPFGWIKNNDTKRLRNIISIDNCSIDVNGYFDTAFNVYKFADGAPFGVMEE